MDSVLIVQHGHFGQAYRRFADGGPETYRDQRISVDLVAGLAPAARVTSLALGNEVYQEDLAENLHASCLDRRHLGSGEIARAFDAAAPSHVILRTPHLGFLQQAQRRGLWVLPVFADIFSPGGPRRWLHHRRLRQALLAARAPCISNHSLNASRALVEVVGIPATKVVPWDWSKVPLAGPPKTGVADPTRPSAFFAGAVIETKGVGDCLEAVAALRRDGLRLTMRFAGKGDLDRWQARAQALGIAEQVRFLGMISNGEVRREMHAADFVIVPSHHAYAEGLPNTIYEGLASRSALIISDHPAFAGRLRPDHECLVFPAATPTALAACLARATKDPALYGRLSENAEKAHDSLYVGLEWTALVRAFLRDPGNDTGWVAQSSLAQLARG
jgi:glycosyltransferase involved in cell wall biosynthesis